MLSSSSAALSASSAINTFDVTATVAATCTIEATSVAFGIYDPVIANATAPLTNGGGVVAVTCTKGAVPVISLGTGKYPTGTVRHMMGDKSGDSLTYELYQPPSTTANVACTFSGATVWNDSNPLTASAAPTKDTRSYSICGSIAGGQDVAVDEYSDTVTASVSF